jgi:hypothetical protein
MDLTQIVIVISLFVITIVLVACGVSVVYLLRDLRTTISKTNEILDDAKEISSSVAKPVSSFSEFVMGFKNGFQLLNTFFNKNK